MPDLTDEKIFPGEIKVRARFSPEVRWRLAEEFGPQSYTETEDGYLLFTADYTDMENLVTWLLTFGDKAEILEPAEVREKIRKITEHMMEIYREERNR